MSRQAELFERAAACDRLLKAEADEAGNIPDNELAEQIASIEEIQDSLANEKDRLQ